MDAAPTLLVLRALNLGDLLVTVPALRALRRRFPDHRLVLATNPRLQPIVDRIGGVDALLPQRGLTPPGVRAPEIAVDLHHVAPESYRALAATSPGRLVAFTDPRTGHDGPATREGEHERRRWLRLVEELGAEGDPDDVLLATRMPADAVPPTIVHPGAAWGSKRWPADRFAVVVRELAVQGHHVVLTGSAEEAPVTAAVAAAAGLPPESDLAGRTSLPELLDLVAAARLVVSNDTGIAHLATAFARPSVTLFGPASPRLWGPPEHARHVAIWHGHAEQHVLTHEVDPALLDVTVEEVLQATDDVLATEPVPT
ncbi:MAG: glycosyltransferase family 9 protein [Kineosporiaceae bacterium]